MSNVQIPNLPAAIALNGTEQMEAVQAGVSVRVTVDQILESVGSGAIAALSEFADDAAAAAGGVPVNGLYHTASVVKQRVS
jgi:hypothetical protein